MIGYYQLYLGSNGEVDIVPVMPVLLVNTRHVGALLSRVNYCSVIFFIYKNVKPMASLFLKVHHSFINW